MQSIEKNSRRILRLPEVMDITGFSKSWIYELMGKGHFPTRRKIGSKSVGWDSYEIAKWVNAQLDEVNSNFT